MLVLQAVRGDRVDHVRVLRLVEEPVDEAHGVEAEVPADRGILEAGPKEELRRVDRARCHDDRPGAHRLPRARRSDELDARRLAALDDHALDRRVGAELEDPARQRVGDVRVHRRLAGIRRAALDARPAARAVRVGVRVDRLELGPERTEARHDRVNALLPVRALSDAEHPLDVLVVRGEVRDGERGAPVARQAARRMPLRDVALVRAEGDLRVDRRRAPDAARGEKGDELTVLERREAERPEEVVGCLRLEAREVVGAEVRSALDEQDVAAPLRELACDHAAAGAGPDHDDLVGVLHAIPSHDQSFLSRVASGELKSISSQAPGPSLPGATKSE